MKQWWRHEGQDHGLQAQRCQIRSALPSAVGSEARNPDGHTGPRVGLCDVDPFNNAEQEVRQRSVLALKHGAGHKDIDEGKYPTNEQVMQALQQMVLKSAEVSKRYRRVVWYSVFVLVYLSVLYLQASAYKSADVVSTLRNALMDGQQLSMTFNNENEVLDYLADKVLLPTWKDPICGDGQCEYPWEFPAFGRFGCASDCGAESNTTKLAINIRVNFVGHTSIPARVLMASVRWNLCLYDEERTARGDSDLCWWEDDQIFNDVRVNQLESAEVPDGIWYLIIKGDYTGRVTGSVYDVSLPNSPDPVDLIPSWEKCKIADATTDSTTRSVRLRTLLDDYKSKRVAGNHDPQLLRDLRKHHFPELPELDAPTAGNVIQERLESILARKRNIEALRILMKDQAASSQGAETLIGGNGIIIQQEKGSI